MAACLARQYCAGKELIGVLALTRTAVRPFNKKQINLLTTLADQAVIAIENMRSV